MQVIDQYKTSDWPDWLDIMISTNKEAITMSGLQTLIKHKFTCSDRPKYMLKQLQKLKQGQKDMKDFITEFENLKLLAKISNDHAPEILQTNVSWKAMKSFIACYSPPANYQGLKNNLIKIG